MKTSQIFLKELTRPKIDKPIFWDYFCNDEKLRFNLFKEYLATETKPDLQLYLDEHFAENPNTDRNELIYKLRSEFYDLIGADKVPQEYYSHTIEHTEIYKSLDLVFTGIKDYKKDAFKPEFDRQDTVDFLKDIIRLLEGIKTPISASRILQDFINDKENIWLQSHLILGSKNEFEKKYHFSYEDAEKKYRKLKKQADNYLTDYFDTIENEPHQETKKKPGRKSVEVKEAKEYLQKFEFPESKVKFLNALKKEYADATPKTFNHVMIALNDLGYLKPATKTEYRQAFEKALSREPQSKQNFDKQFEITPSTLKNTNFYEGIKSNILEIIQSKTLV